jgi:hypothetical protein
MATWWASLEPKEQAVLISGIVGALFGVFGGVLGPILKGAIDDRNQERRLRYEAENLRQQKLIDAQSAMLDDLASALWDWRYAAMRVAFFGYNADEQEYIKAAEGYKREIWPILSKIRFIAARCRRLISESSFQRIRDFYMKIVDLNEEIMDSLGSNDETNRRMHFMDISTGIFKNETNTIDEILLKVAAETHLLNRQERR